jgi:hypothetical protein
MLKRSCRAPDQGEMFLLCRKGRVCRRDARVPRARSMRNVGIRFSVLPSHSGTRHRMRDRALENQHRCIARDRDLGDTHSVSSRACPGSRGHLRPTPRQRGRRSCTRMSVPLPSFRALRMKPAKLLESFGELVMHHEDKFF